MNRLPQYCNHQELILAILRGEIAYPDEFYKASPPKKGELIELTKVFD